MIKISLFKTFVILLCIIVPLSYNSAYAAKPEYYQLKIYHLKDKNQGDRLENYLKQAYLPALHRAGIKKVGVFKASDNADSLVYILIPFNSAEQFSSLSNKLAADKSYLSAADDYLNTSFDNPVFKHIESVFMDGISGMPLLQLPDLKAAPSERVYELRRYEAASEKLHDNKISQFNNGELDIFKRLGFNTIFCGKAIAGSKLPSLFYMTSFENKTDRDAHWKSFSADPAWVALNARPEYAHNFLRADIYLLHPTAYSEI
ncbi:NIPSNAP family protein [Dyadobacter subterraneus]|uniref:NIPSNAP family protein n=1 Tax=Dyadobacter subterraneus TaxID=2773304 RepID=A0ABR9WCY8_9BACT|nr:NIPSNAP family protein [Dyadobacter subterraneus]MBE9463285.1 NIPSNAP family protein [Dyadobacter subterraneus]